MDADLVARAHLVAGDIDGAAIHQHMPVAHQLASLLAARAKAQSVDDVVQAQFETNEQILTRDAGLIRRTLEKRLEVALGHAINALHLLLLTQLLRVVRGFLAPCLRQTVLSGCIIAPLDRALLRVALRALEEQLLPFAAAKLANWTGITSHESFPSLFWLVTAGTSSRPDGVAVYIPLKS